MKNFEINLDDDGNNNKKHLVIFLFDKRTLYSSFFFVFVCSSMNMKIFMIKKYDGRVRLSSFLLLFVSLTSFFCACLFFILLWPPVVIFSRVNSRTSTGSRWRHPILCIFFCYWLVCLFVICSAKTSNKIFSQAPWIAATAAPDWEILYWNLFVCNFSFKIYRFK